MAMLPNSIAMSLSLRNAISVSYKVLIPIPFGRHITRDSQSKHKFSKTKRIAVAQQKLAIAID
jgi:hypothetical protein